RSVIGMPEVMVVRPNGLDRPDGSTIAPRGDPPPTYRPAREATSARAERRRGSETSPEAGRRDADPQPLRQPRGRPPVPQALRACTSPRSTGRDGARLGRWDRPFFVLPRAIGL